MASRETAVKDVAGLAAYIGANMATENAQTSLRPYLAKLNADHATNKKFIPISQADSLEIVAPAFNDLGAIKLQQFDLLTRGEAFDASKPDSRAAMQEVLSGSQPAVVAARATLIAAVRVSDSVVGQFGYETIGFRELGEVLRLVPESYISRYLAAQ